MDVIIKGKNNEEFVIEKTEDQTKQNILRLKAARQKTGMTQKEFANYFDFSARAVEEWERGGRRIPMYLLKLIEYKIDKEGFGKDK